LAKGANQKIKLLYILDILKRLSDENHPLNAAEISDELAKKNISAERKSIYDDIAQLELYGCDIIKAHTPKKGWFIGDREFEVPEIYLLSDAVRSAKFISRKKTRELLAKLGSMLSVHQEKQHNSNVYFGNIAKSANEEIYYNIDKINSAIEEKRQIKIKYASRKLDSGREVLVSEKEMVINPYSLCWQDDHYYLLGNYAKYNNLIHLRLDRIYSVDVLSDKARHFSEVSEYTDHFDTADYVDKLFGMHGGELCEVEFRCNKRITEPVLDRFGEDIFIIKVTENEFGFRVKAALSGALVSWIISYGEDLRVEKPEALKEMVKDRAKAVLEIYNHYNGYD